MIGIYEIVNTVDGSVYIGSSVNIDMRFIIHRGALRRGNHQSAV